MTSFFQAIRSRELSGFSGKRPYIGDKPSDFAEFGALAVGRNAEETPPLALSFGKTSEKSHVLAVTDEDGYVSLFDTRKKFPSQASHQECSDKARISSWVAHQNAIFDICWIKEDTNMLTASGDQTIKLWDVHEMKCTGVLMGHTGSVKSIYSHPTNSDILVSGSRDGSFAIWDLRCKDSSASRYSEASITLTAMVKRAHPSVHAKRVRKGKAASMSITSVLYLRDEVSIATAGAVDSILKFWDIRKLKVHVTQACPHSSTEKERRLHGISCLSQDSSGVNITASCMDNRIYLYDTLQLENGPKQSFSGCRIESFFVKSVISPDATHILSGSSDGNAYIWQVNKPDRDPILLKNHVGEVTAVNWCAYDGKLATSSDDFTVRIWNIQNSDASNPRSPSSNRRRIMAIPTEECRRLKMDDEMMSPEKHTKNLRSSDEGTPQIDSRNSIAMPTASTPESQKRKFSSILNSTETFERTPEAALRSPSSVLNPPSSLKRKTIRDYFLAA